MNYICLLRDSCGRSKCNYSVYSWEYPFGVYVREKGWKKSICEPKHLCGNYKIRNTKMAH